MNHLSRKAASVPDEHKRERAEEDEAQRQRNREQPSDMGHNKSMVDGAARLLIQINLRHTTRRAEIWLRSNSCLARWPRAS